MLSSLFLAFSVVGAEWIPYLLLLFGVASAVLIFERVRFLKRASKGIAEFQEQLRQHVLAGRWVEALDCARIRNKKNRITSPDLLTATALSLLELPIDREHPHTAEVMNELAKDAITRTRLVWEKNLAVLSMIGTNAPFVGLFGTVLGIIKAFFEMSQKVASSTQSVTAGISEAMVSTALGLLVAIPAVVSYYLLKRKLRAATTEAEALKSFLIGHLCDLTRR